ncbi:MAG TPA: nuclear transport factor 2 family protein [Chthoniobacterales bacterium]|jgi:hypothetical protein|nr:nuclear transport factor 2 family protein [Chthoniobacterales bacterium]
MSTALDITKQAYEAFRRRDIPAFLKLVADEVDWKLIGPASWPHAGLRQNPSEVGAFFADLNRFDDLTLFEPREFIEAGENVTVLGYLASSYHDLHLSAPILRKGWQSQVVHPAPPHPPAQGAEPLGPGVWTFPIRGPKWPE